MNPSPPTFPDLTASPLGWLALGIFAVGYCFVVAEEFTNLRKSKPLVIAAGAIWLIVAIAWRNAGVPGAAAELRRNLLAYAELLLFLLAAMTYVNALQERGIFDALRVWLIRRRLSFRGAFWLTGLMAFCLSPLMDNLTTALVMGAVVIAIGQRNAAFIGLACVNIVVAANAGGAFSPFGDITTLMVWQHGRVDFLKFFALFAPALANWMIPALCLTLAVPGGKPAATAESTRIKRGGWLITALFVATIALTVLAQHFAGLPPFIGMMTGLGLLQILAFFIRHQERRDASNPATPFDIFVCMQRIEWDTLLFFYGVMLCVGGLAALGFLATFSSISYAAFGPTVANVGLGVASALIDNIPIMFAVLNMDPSMSQGQWLLVTLTAGVGGSLLSIGSAAGVALMGQARGSYTFFSHLKWTWAVALGYAISIWLHLTINAGAF